MIQLRDVFKSFDRPVLHGVSLEVPRGAAWGLIGPGASGKSVLLKLVCGLLRPDAGAVEVAGRDVAALDDDGLASVRARIGMLFQQNALFDFMTVHENVAFPLRRTTTLPDDEIHRRVRERLRAVGLAGSEEKFPSQLSGGMRKRCAIARASVARPELVIYDEPTAGLDPVTTSRIYDLLRADQQETGATVLVVSSDVDGLRGFVTRMAMIHQGRIRYDGEAAGIEDAADPVVRQFVRGELEGPL
ncbi:MAG: ATP-binding cassette domain-containing protein [Myxococcota bacterium]